MKENAKLILYEEEIKNILLEDCFGEYHPEVKKQIMETAKLVTKQSKKNFNLLTKNVDFIIEYDQNVESIGRPIIINRVYNINDLINIINEKISKREYKIDGVTIGIRYPLEKYQNNQLNYLTFYLKKKENIKTKKKGLRKNV